MTNSRMEKAKPGERYLLGGVNATYTDFFITIDTITGVKRKLYSVPFYIMLFLAQIELFKGNALGKQPIMTPAFVRKYTKHWSVNSAKAEKELGHTITPLVVGIAKTLNWLKSNENNILYKT